MSGKKTINRARYRRDGNMVFKIYPTHYIRCLEKADLLNTCRIEVVETATPWTRLYKDRAIRKKVFDEALRANLKLISKARNNKL